MAYYSTTNLKIVWLVYFSPGRNTHEAIQACWAYPDISESPDIQKREVVFGIFLSGLCAIQEVSGVNLDSRFVCINFQFDTALFRFQRSTYFVDVPFGSSTQLWSIP